MLLLCNDMLELDNVSSEAYLDRAVYINFPTKFVANPKEPHEKLIDEKLTIEEYKLEFFHLLLDYYRKYKINGLPQNKEIEEFTNQVSEETNMELLFMRECTEEANTNLFITKIYDAYTNWYSRRFKKSPLGPRQFNTNIKIKYNI